MIKQLLTKPNRLQSEIVKLIERVDALKASLLPMGIRYDTDRVQTSPDDRTAAVMAEIDRLEREIRKKYLEKAETIAQIGKLIDTLDDEREAQILNAYYLAGMPIREIAQEMYYCENYIYDLKRRGEMKLSEESENYMC